MLILPVAHVVLNINNKGNLTMKFGNFRSTAILTTALITGLSVSSTTFAEITEPRLTVQDGYVTTIVDKSVVSGSIRRCDFDGVSFTPKEAGNMCSPAPMLGYEIAIIDGIGYLLFDYSGTVNSIDTNKTTGELEKMEKPIGTISGTAAFPPAFGEMAGVMFGAMNGVPLPEGFVPPAVIEWTCKTCNMVVNGTSYTSIVDSPEMFMPGSEFAMKMKGRAFTGLGPVEMGQIVPGASLSVRMAGCSAVTGGGKVGTLCLNGTFTFDMSNMMVDGSISGTGTSNCITVLHEPMSM